MKCFEITINGVKVCTAGIGDDGVLTSIMSLGKRKNDSEMLDLRVGGLAHREAGATEQLEWINQNLAVGDEVTIKIVEASECDEANRKEVTYGGCSFCNKRQGEVAKLIAGPAVYICDECVGDCLAALGTREPSGTITTIIDKAAEVRCSFCGKQPSEIAGMVGVATARVCNECIKICDDILASDQPT